MKYLLAILILCSTVSASVKNTGSTRRDSVAIWVVCLDSTGKPSTCDSFYVRVVNNSTNAVLFSDSGTATMTGLDSISGKSEYYYHRAVADIDGGGTDGEYILAVNAKKTAGSGWTTPNSRIFQIQNILYADSAIFQRLGVYNTVASTTTNDYAAVEFSSTGDSSFAFVVKNTGIAGAKFKGSAFKLYSKTHSGILAIGGATGSPASGGLYLLDSSTGGYGQYTRSTASGYSANYIEDVGGSATQLGPFGGDITDNVFTAPDFHPNVANEIAGAIMKDTTRRIGVKGGLGDSVLTPIPTVTVGDVTLAAGQFTKIGDTALLKIGTPLKPSDTDELRNNIVTALGVPLKPSDTDELRANIIAAMTVPLKPSDTDELRNNIVTALGIPLKPSDTDELRANIIAAMTVPLKPSDTDELRANIIAAIPNNEVWTAAQRDSVIARQLALRDTAHIIDSIVKAMSPILTQARDSINAISTWLDPTLDSLLYASGFKQGARSIQGVSNDCDTLHVKIGTTEWFKMLFYHVGGTPGARPDSTITVAP